MAPRIQIVIDAGDPHALARFWAAALSLEVEDHSSVVEHLLGANQLQPDEAVTVEGRRAFRDVATCIDSAGRHPRMFFQRVPETKTGKNRVHLDIQVGADAAPAEVQRLQSLGATVAWVTSDRGPVTTTMQDPEGNDFCVS